MVKRAPKHEFTMESLREFERLLCGCSERRTRRILCGGIPPGLRRDLTATLNEGKVSKHNQLESLYLQSNVYTSP
jgi:hypothetical protein